MLTKIIQIIASLVGHVIKSFAIALLVLEVGCGGLLALVCFWIAGNDSWLHGIIAAVLSLVLVSIVSVILAGYYAAISGARKAVADAGIGKAVFDRLFEHVLGVAGEDPDDVAHDDTNAAALQNIGEVASGETDPQATPARVPVKMSAAELKARFNAAARHILAEEQPVTKLPRPLFWLARKIESITIWATVKVIVKSCSNEGDSINLFDVRDRLAGVIDNHVIRYVKQYFYKLSLVAMLVAAFLAILVACLLRLLPF